MELCKFGELEDLMVADNIGIIWLKMYSTKSINLSYSSKQEGASYKMKLRFCGRKYNCASASYMPIKNAQIQMKTQIKHLKKKINLKQKKHLTQQVDQGK